MNPIKPGENIYNRLQYRHNYNKHLQAVQQVTLLLRTLEFCWKNVDFKTTYIGVH